MPMDCKGMKFYTNVLFICFLMAKLGINFFLLIKKHFVFASIARKMTDSDVMYCLYGQYCGIVQKSEFIPNFAQKFD